MTRAAAKLALPLQPSAPHHQQDVWSLIMIWYTVSLRVSSPEPSGPETEALPLGHRSPSV
ncbi:hypothetical protein AVEN_170645-1, partial [Araneus ventricosus]